MKKNILIGTLVFLLLVAIGAAVYYAEQNDSDVAKTVATETVEDEPCVVPDEPTQKILPGTAWDFDHETCEFELVAVEPIAEPVAAADEPADEDATLEPTAELELPPVLDELFGTGSIDLGRIIVPDTSNSQRPDGERGFQYPQYPAVVPPVDEDGMFLFSAGYYGITVGPIVDQNGPIFRATGEWEENLTHWVFVKDHDDDTGAHEVGFDHYAGGSVSTGSGFPTVQQFITNLYVAVNHDSGINNEVDPAPRVRVHIIYTESGEHTMLDITYNGGDDWTFGNPITEQLPTIEEWLASH